MWARSIRREAPEHPLTFHNRAGPRGRGRKVLMIRPMLVAHLLTGFMAVVTPVSQAWGAGASSWTPRVRERMVVDALKVAPPALVRIILKHPDSFRAGLSDAAGTEGTAEHRETGTEPGAAVALDTVIKRAVGAIDNHHPMTDVAYFMGVLAHIAADLSDPLKTAPAGEQAPFAADFPSYVERNIHRFPAVFYGWNADAAASAVDAGAAARSAAAVSRPYFAHLERAYAATGGSSASFDVRSVPFGVGSVCYSRAVTEIARSWLSVWMRAHGDLTGTPWLVGAPQAAPPRAATAAPAGSSAHAPPPPLDNPATQVEENGAMTAANVEDPNGASVTKTILGKSRKRLSKAAASEANLPAPTDPNGRERTDGSKD